MDAPAPPQLSAPSTWASSLMTPLSGSGAMEEIAPGVARLVQPIVNAYFIGVPSTPSRSWVLVDAGLPFTATTIRRAAAQRFGPDSCPAAILLTHGHFDHVGALADLAEQWNVPVYAHELELPYVTGRSSYPPPDPTVGGGVMSFLSRLYPRGPVDVGRRALPLPPDRSIPGLPQWRWIPTPGHTPGHVSFFRDADRILLAGDAFVTTRQESAVAALAKWPQVWRPPAYYTTDWSAARDSIERLAALNPHVAGTGHGVALYGDQLSDGLAALLDNWDHVVPADGRYVRQPALADTDGVVAIPPAVADPAWKVGLVIGAAALACWFVVRQRSRES
ncbi:MAG: MBL fold metallo-hydrolase [Pirellulaceae bacterium]